MSKLIRSFALFLCCCLLTLLIACAAPSSPSSTTPTVSIPVSVRYADEFCNNWCYRLLSSRLQQCYGTVFTALREPPPSDDVITVREDNGDTNEYIGIKILLPLELSSKEEAQELYNAVFYDNPQFFYISSMYTLEGYAKNDEPHYDQINLIYTMDRKQRQSASAALEEAVDNALKGAPLSDDQFPLELHLHDRLAAICSYDTAGSAAGYALSPQAYTAYGALVNGRAVCEGYSRAMQLLLKRGGIDCSLVTGRSVHSGESHMWNVVTINGKNYHLDVTWDDSDERLRHNYFNVTTEQVKRSHHIDADQLGVDTCTSVTDNYFIRFGSYLDTYDRDEIAIAVARQIKDGGDCVELAFADDKFDNALLFLKNATLTKQMVNAQLAKDEAKLWDYILRGETQECILTLYKQ